MSDIAIEPYEPSEADEVLAVINDAFEVPRSSEWFQWKHLDAPWGPSRGVIARDEQGMVGVRLLLPWKFVVDGEPLLAYRAVEASTMGRAQGQGIFSRLNRALMEELSQRDPSSFLFSTPNQLSRNGYRKLGWTWLEPVAHSYRPTPRRRSTSDTEFVDGDGALHTYQEPEDGSELLRTAWDEDSLRWRIDIRTGNDYRVLAASNTSGSGGVAYRIIEVARRRAILVVHRWGNEELISLALAEVGRQERVRMLLDVETTGPRPKLAFRKGESLLTTWTPREPAGVRGAVHDSARWQTTFADLESVL